MLELLAAESDAARAETTTIEALADALDADEAAVEAHLQALEACELARIGDDGNVRVTITGEELLELDLDGSVIVDPTKPDEGG